MITTSIIIPTLFGDQSLRDCIQSIQDYTDLSGVEVIIVANGCPVSTLTYLSRLPYPFRYIWNNQELGFPKAVNIGIQASLGEYIVLLNDDCKLLPQEKNTWIQQLKAPFQDDGRVGVVGPHALKDPITEYLFLPYYCVMFQRSMLEQVGLLDEGFGPGGCEDIDHCIRIQEAEYTIFALPKIEEAPREGNYAIGTFPLYHEAEHTVIPYFKDKQNDWEAIFWNNQEHLRQKWVERSIVTSIIPSLKGKRLTFPEKDVVKAEDALREVLNHPAPHPFEATVIHVPKNDDSLMEADRRIPVVKSPLPSLLRLNLGCGDMLLDGYINVDKYDDHADRQWDAVALPLSSNSVDEIYSSHLIEHFDFHQGQQVLKEWKRVLKEGGVLGIETPDFLASCKKFVNANEQERVELYSHFFSTPWIDGQVHKFLYTPVQMRWTLEQLGFKEIHQERALRYIDREDICMKFVCRK